MPLRLWLAASLLINLVLAAGLYQATPEVRARYAQQWLGRSVPSPLPSWQSHGEKLGEAPTRAEAFSSQRLDRAVPAHAYAGQAGPAFDAWRSDGRAAFARVLAYDPVPFPGEVRVTERWDFETYTREKLYLRTASGLWLPGYLCVPKGLTAPRPAVLALPGHDGPIERGAYWATGPYAWPEVKPYMRAFGRRLAEAGYVVLAIDVAGIGELGYLGYERLVNEGLLIGEPLKGLMLEEVHEAVDYLLTRPEVDPARIGTAGVSLGGELAMYAAVLDPRLAFVASSGFLTSYRDSGGTAMASLYLPGILEVADIPDLAAMVAPRPMLIQAGRNDREFRIETVRGYLETVSRAYQAAGAAGALSIHEHDEGHTMVVEPLLAWLERVAPLPGRRPYEPSVEAEGARK